MAKVIRPYERLFARARPDHGGHSSYCEMWRKYREVGTSKTGGGAVEKWTEGVAKMPYRALEILIEDMTAARARGARDVDAVGPEDRFVTWPLAEAAWKEWEKRQLYRALVTALRAIHQTEPLRLAA